MRSSSSLAFYTFLPSLESKQPVRARIHFSACVVLCGPDIVASCHSAAHHRRSGVLSDPLIHPTSVQHLTAGKPEARARQTAVNPLCSVPPPVARGSETLHGSLSATQSASRRYPHPCSPCGWTEVFSPRICLPSLPQLDSRSGFSLLLLVRLSWI